MRKKGDEGVKIGQVKAFATGNPRGKKEEQAQEKENAVKGHEGSSKRRGGQQAECRDQR